MALGRGVQLHGHTDQPDAACKLWLLRNEQNKGKEADAILDRLAPIYQLETLAALIPAQDRDAILSRYRQSGVWGTVAWGHDNDLKRIEQAMRVQDLLNSDDYDRRMTKWRLVDILRMEGEGQGGDERAMKVLRELLEDPAAPPDERVEVFRDFAWMRINQGSPGPSRSSSGSTSGSRTTASGSTTCPC